MHLPGFWKWDPSATGKALPAFPCGGRLVHVVVVMVGNHGIEGRFDGGGRAAVQVFSSGGLPQPAQLDVS
jgi:hypothetical protein